MRDEEEEEDLVALAMCQIGWSAEIEIFRPAKLFIVFNRPTHLAPSLMLPGPWISSFFGFNIKGLLNILFPFLKYIKSRCQASLFETVISNCSHFEMCELFSA